MNLLEMGENAGLPRFARARFNNHWILHKKTGLTEESKRVKQTKISFYINSKQSNKDLL